MEVDFELVQTCILEINKIAGKNLQFTKVLWHNDLDNPENEEAVVSVVVNVKAMKKLPGIGDKKVGQLLVQPLKDAGYRVFTEL
jgi:hypothetical protein